jgi:hypothetical protein
MANYIEVENIDDTIKSIKLGGYVPGQLKKHNLRNWDSLLPDEQISIQI